MKINSLTFIKQLKQSTNELIVEAKKLQSLTFDQLQKKPHEKSWNVLECVEHMNLYHTYYLPEIKQQINNAKHPAKKEFKSGWLGNYSAQNMLPKKADKVNMPMNTFKDMNPIGQDLQVEVLQIFVAQLEEFCLLLEASKEVDLRKTKCQLTIKWLKFTLGDTLHFMINHNIRHMNQIKKILVDSRSAN